MKSTNQLPLTMAMQSYFNMKLKRSCLIQEKIGKLNSSQIVTDPEQNHNKLEYSTVFPNLQFS